MKLILLSKSTAYLQIASELEEMKYKEAIEQAEQLGIEKKELSELVLQAVANT